MTNASTKSRPRLITGNALIYLLGALLIGSAVVKVTQIPTVLENFRVLGYEGSRLTSIAVLEAVCAALFMLPRTRSLGLLLVSAYLGGAMAVHVAHGQSDAVRPAILLGIIWLAAWLRHPQILWSFGSRVFGKDQPSEITTQLGLTGSGR
jgi:hypothetical protein